MSKVVVLGGCGGIGTVAVKTLAVLAAFDEVVVADVRLDAARALCDRLGDARVTPAEFDATSHASILAVLRGADVVLNCVGPFYRFGPPILRAAIEAKVPYVDICDDLAPTLTMLELDAEAKAAGIPALIGMGNSPGLANVFVKLVKDMLLDAVKTVDIMHIHGGEATEGPAVLKHRIHAMMNDIPLFIDGKMVYVRQLEASGEAYVRETSFRGVGEYPVYPYPHPETITLPKFIPGLERATNLGVIYPLSYFRLTQDMVRVGACSDTPINVNGQDVIPLDFSVAHILSRRAALLAEAGIERQGGCLKVVVGGIKSGKAQTYVLSLSAADAGAGEGTGIPAAIGALLVGTGKVAMRGVFPPEAAVNPMEVMQLALVAASKLGTGGRDSIHIESIDAEGNITELPLAL